jgi:hypothetical protein
MNRIQRTVAVALAAAAVAVSLGPTSPASARGGAKPSTGSSIAVVLLDSTDGVAHYGQRVTFSVSTTATTKPMVSLDCYQSGTHVYWASAGFYEGYPWPWNREFQLASSYWTGGAADCTATLYSNGRNGRIVTLATTGFPAAA